MEKPPTRTLVTMPPLIACPALGPPVTRWKSIAESAAQHEHKIDDGHRNEGLPDADRGRRPELVHQDVRKRRADHGTAAEAHDGHAGRHAGLGG